MISILAACVLAAFVVCLGIGAVWILQAREGREITEKSVERIMVAARTCLASGNDQLLEVNILFPVSFHENRILIHGSVYGEVEIPFAPAELEPGKHRIRISLENSRLVLRKIA